MPAKTLTIYSFGYWGWGTATAKLVEAMDTAEKARGNEPPFFVDVRARRNVRAPGFRENAFGDLVGTDRYLWMPRLGNQRVLERKPGVKIVDPVAAAELLDLTSEVAKKKQPVVFFCACPWPRLAPSVYCHRVQVARLLLREARSRGKKVTIVEWPGGEPEGDEYRIEPADMKKLVRGGWYVTLRGTDWMCFSGLPWGSVVRLYTSEGDEMYGYTGPPVWRLSSWQLSFQGWISNSESLEKDIRSFRKDNGLEPYKI